ncbi:MAG: methyl-accepting chemotaxis protein [Gemmatimonadaceae bacterium]|nr:methyl-accepting chemotaxis protein [Gemmatimonadaceae bacterium]
MVPQETHIIDRVTALLTWLCAFGLVVCVWAAWDTIQLVVASGEGWLIILPSLFLAALAAAASFRYWISPMVGHQLAGLADVAEAVAAGDLTRIPKEARQGGQMGRLARAMVAMTAELRTLATLIAESTAETTRLASEINGGTEHMAQAATGIADTAGTLSEQAGAMAQTIQLLAADTTRLTDLAHQVTQGAQEGILRNQRLRTLASDNHERLDESTQRLEALAADVRESAAATDALAAQSDQIRAFVLLVQKIARQSKLLALNAAMEAARAGEQGEGFAVVASEVRRLAQAATEAAEQTDAQIGEVLKRVDAARATSARLLAAVANVREATEHGRHSFTQVEQAVEESEAWTGEIAASSGAGSALAAEINRRLDTLTEGTQAFASAMHEVAAASQEQSASTQEIAAATTALTDAAERIARTSASFRG